MARWHEVQTFVGRVFWPLRKSRITTLAALVVGLLRKQQVGLAAIALGMLDGTTVKHRVKRIGRFLGNKAFQPWEVTEHLIETITYNETIGPGERVRLTMTWTPRNISTRTTCTAHVDHENVVDELSEANNAESQNIRVTAEGGTGGCIAESVVMAIFLPGIVMTTRKTRQKGLTP